MNGARAGGSPGEVERASAGRGERCDRARWCSSTDLVVRRCCQGGSRRVL